jgi:hypothetical protein
MAKRDVQLVEIETGVRADGKWGYIIWYYRSGLIYDGQTDVMGHYDTEQDALDGAEKNLDTWFGKRGWKHI